MTELLASAPPDIEGFVAAIYEELLYEELFDVSAEAHYQVYRHSLRPNPSTAPTRDNGLLTARCRLCGDLVGVKRFSMHLFKCMRGGRRGDTRKPQPQDLTIDFRNYPAFKRKCCNIVRIQMENGGEARLH